MFSFLKALLPKIQGAEFKSRINQVSRVPSGAIRKAAGPDFEREGHVFSAKELLLREVAFLKKLSAFDCFPKVLAEGKDFFEMSDCGVLITAESCPADWRQQSEKILSALDSVGIVHRDIKAQNLLVKSGTIYLIDFGWAISPGENRPCAQDFTTSIPRKLIYDNRAAMEAAFRGLGKM